MRGTLPASTKTSHTAERDAAGAKLISRPQLKIESIACARQPIALRFFDLVSQGHTKIGRTLEKH